MIKDTVGAKQSILVSSYHINGKVCLGVDGVCDTLMMLMGITKPNRICFCQSLRSLPKQEITPSPDRGNRLVVQIPVWDITRHRQLLTTRPESETVITSSCFLTE